jgi:tRNA(Ile)-lysidine synthase
MTAEGGADRAAGDGRPIGSGEFAALMAGLGGFEPQPRLAVAVSGGADSLALCLLCHQWAEARGGSVLALTVDHRLRLESTAEAAAVNARLSARGIAHVILTWHGDKPVTGIQDAARAARYRLLIEHAAEAGLLHLMLAHHRDDQAETLLLRLSRASGLDGLAGMAAIRELPALRLLRPLLCQPKTRLEATLLAFGLTWHHDPSNLATTYARGRLRRATDTLGREGLTSRGLAETARRLGLARAALDDATAALLGRSAAVDPRGFVWLEPEPLAAAPGEIGRRALARCLAVVGRADPPPRREGLDLLFGAIGRGLPDGRTLAGCRILRHRHRLLVVREPADAAAPAALAPGRRLWWDRRFLIRLAPDAGNGVVIGALGDDGWLEARDRIDATRQPPVPAPARATLPALRDQHGLLAVPHLGISRSGRPATSDLLFAPAMPLAGATFGVAWNNAGLI